MEYVEYLERLERSEVMENLERYEENSRQCVAVRQYLPRPDPFDRYSDCEFLRRYRFSKSGMEKLYERLGEQMNRGSQSNAGLPVSPRLQLLATLHLFAKGGYQECVAELHGISQPSMSRILRKVTMALVHLRAEEIKFPSDPISLRREMSHFYEIAGFPQVIGCIDCTHVKIRNPGGDNALTYMNRKGFYSLNVQVVASADLKIRNIVSRWRGSTHDSRIFRESNLRTKLERGLYRGVLLGDGGYACERYLLTPVRNPQVQAELTYNSSHIKTRNVVERLFGVWKMTFRSLYRGLNVNDRLCRAMIVAMAVLHNIRRDYRMEDVDSDSEDDMGADEDREQEDEAHIEGLVEHGHSGNAFRRWFMGKYF